jgi:cobyrinic acid a,c-diamide synthase
MTTTDRHELGEEFRHLTHYVNGKIDAEELIRILKSEKAPASDPYGMWSARSEIEQIKAARRKAHAFAVANVRLEGLVIDSRFAPLFDRYVNCQISIAQAIAEAKALFASDQ